MRNSGALEIFSEIKISQGRLMTTEESKTDEGKNVLHVLIYALVELMNA